MSHADKADKLLIKPAAGARPAPPRTRRQFIPKARTRRPVTRRVTRGTTTTRLATDPDRPTPRLLQSPNAWWLALLALLLLQLAESFDGGLHFCRCVGCRRVADQDVPDTDNKVV